MVYTPQNRSPPPQQGPAPKDQDGGAYPLAVPRGLYESAVEGTVVGSSAATAAAATAPNASVVDTPVTHVGLINQGATCYMNSLLQLFFHISYFREAVYRMTTDASDESEIPKAIQNLFFQMQERRSSVSTKCLTDAFGWDEREVFIQHDIQELAAKLRDTLEGKMKGTPAEGAINRMFTGYGETVTCTLDTTYTSRRKDEFYDVHLPVRDYRTLQESLKSLVAKDQLTGSNQYKVEEEGKPPVYKDAETGYEYSRFPPVLLFHLKRFEMDMMSPTLEMKKVNSAFEFPTSINLSEYEHSSAELKASTKLKTLTGEEEPASGAAADDVDDPAIYDLYGVIVHRGGVRSGHYYAFIREYDPEAQQWRRWLKYDDDEVTEVSEAAAVDRNFGGTAYTWLNGRQVSSVSTHSAYILAYMRRGDIKRLIYPISTNAIPAHVKEELERVMREDERLQREEDDRNRTVTLHMILDEAIQQHVGRATYELVPGASTSPTFGASFSLVLQKQNTLQDLYNAMKERNCFPARLWRMSPPFQGAQLRPDSPLPPLDEQSATTTLQEVFARGPGDDTAKAIVAPLYVELPRVHVPALATNAATLVTAVRVTSSMMPAENKDDLKAVVRSGGLIRFDPADRVPTLTVEMSKPLPVTFLSFKIVFGRNAYLFEQTVSVALFDKDPQAADSAPVWTHKRTLTLSSHASASASVYLALQERDENQREKPPPVAKWLVIQRVDSSSRPLAHAFAVNRLVWHTTPEMLQQRPVSNVPELPEYSKETDLNIMLKVFNHRLARITYAGMAIIPRSEPLRNCFPTFRALIGLPPESRQSLLLFDESRPYQISRLDEAHSSSTTEANLFSGNIITCQLDPRDIPLVYRFLQADQYYLWLDRMRHISVHSYSNPSLVFTATMQGTYRVDDIVDVIAKHLPGVNPAYIRIYGPHGYMQPTPRTEPERSDSNATLDNIIYTGSWPVPDLFYEVLDRPVSEVEARLVIPLRFATVLGEPQGEEHIITVPVGTPVDTLVNEFLALHLPNAEERERFKRQYDNTFVIIERSAHLIHAYYPTLPEQRVQQADDSDDCLSRPDGISRVRRDRCYEVRPWTPPLPNQRVIPCGQGDQSQHAEYQPHGTPFLLPIEKALPCEEVLKRLLAVTEIDPATVERGDEEHRNYSLMIYTNCMMFLPDFKNVPLWSYMNGTAKSQYNPTHAFLNRKKPKEKPGSRYVPLHEPQLVLEKKRLPHAKSTDNVQQGAVAAVATIPHVPSTPDLDAAKRFLAS